LSFLPSFVSPLWKSFFDLKKKFKPWSKLIVRMEISQSHERYSFPWNSNPKPSKRKLERWRLIVGKELNHKMEITPVLRKDFL
jgi:hypothetical protein